MRPRSRSRASEKIDLHLAGMTDVVFLLLAFFVLTFKVVVPEGDFTIRMPLAVPSIGPPTGGLPPIHLRLAAGASGELQSIHLNDVPLENFDQVNQHLLDLTHLTRTAGHAGTEEAELDCDADLKYKHVIDAITAVSGTVGDGGQVVKLIDKIRLVKRKKPG